MFELLELEEAQHSFKRGDVVSGTVALVGNGEILIDVGGKSEGILAPKEYAQMSSSERQSREVGDVVEVLIVNPSNQEGQIIVSFSQVRIGQDWDEAEALAESGESFESTVSGHNKGGLIVFMGAVRGFVPVSQLDRRHAIDRSRVDGTYESPLARFADQPIWLKVIEHDRQKNRLILSEQAAMRERRKHLKRDLLASLKEGTVVDGRVTSLADFGAFVDIGGADGLVHLSELSWNRVSHPSELLELGQDVTVKVIAVDRERNRIGLSLKQLQPEPWSTIEDRYQVGEVVEAEITRLADFGAFARLENDIEGLIHVSELSDDEVAPGDVVESGQRVAVRIIRIDPERKRIGLSLKRASDDYDFLGLNAEESDSDSPSAESAGTEVAPTAADTTNADTTDVETPDVETPETESAEADAPDETATVAETVETVASVEELDPEEEASPVEPLLAEAGQA
jgi:small subunit ribosomal protein S1